MGGGIFLIGNGGDLVEMRERPYESEDVLQDLLARYPNLLAGDQVDTASPRRWLLVCREAGVPGEEGGFGRWSLDHLLLDQDAVPTLVEVKRGSDTRVRREVVGQMLDYAANAVVYWSVESIRAMFEANCSRERRDPSEVLAEFLGDGGDAGGFWQRADTNLKAGRIRMVFVADAIPTELRRIVEFLNGQMNPAEVLALELRQYEGSGLRTLVPRVVGQTAESERQKRSGGSLGPVIRWDRGSLLQHLVEEAGEQAAEAAKLVIEWCEAQGLECEGTRAASGSLVYFVKPTSATWCAVVRVRASGWLEFGFDEYAETQAFASDDRRRDLARRLHEAGGGLRHSPSKVTGFHYLDLRKLAREQIPGLTDVIGWLASELRKG